MTGNDNPRGAKQQDITAVPTIAFFEKTYGRSNEDNDEKAARLFRSYETQEKLRRLQTELQLVMQGRVTELVCDTCIGKKRKVRFQSYEKWAERMLIWLSQKKA